MKIPSKALTLLAILFIAVLPFLIGCTSPQPPPQSARSWKPEATKLGIPGQELAQMASEATKRHGGTAFSIERASDAQNIVLVFLGDKKSSPAGKTAVFKKVGDVWQEDTSAVADWIL